MYWGLSELTDYIKRRAIPWKNGKLTRQIKTSQGYIRVYQTHPFTFNDKELQDLSEGELGSLFERRLEPEEINSLVRELPNYTEPFSDEKKKLRLFVGVAKKK